MLKFHKQYGPVIRIAPDEPSYAASPIWKDVFQHRTGVEEFTKDPFSLARPLNGVTASLVPIELTTRVSADSFPTRFRIKEFESRIR